MPRPDAGAGRSEATRAAAALWLWPHIAIGLGRTRAQTVSVCPLPAAFASRAPKCSFPRAVPCALPSRLRMAAATPPLVRVYDADSASSARSLAESSVTEALTVLQCARPEPPTAASPLAEGEGCAAATAGEASHVALLPLSSGLSAARLNQALEHINTAVLLSGAVVKFHLDALEGPAQPGSVQLSTAQQVERQQVCRQMTCHVQQWQAWQEQLRQRLAAVEWDGAGGASEEASQLQSKLAQKRRHTVLEILHSEVRHVQALQAVDVAFAEPMRAKAGVPFARPSRLLTARRGVPDRADSKDGAPTSPPARRRRSLRSPDFVAPHAASFISANALSPPTLSATEWELLFQSLVQVQLPNHMVCVHNLLQAFQAHWGGAESLADDEALLVAVMAALQTVLAFLKVLPVYSAQIPERNSRVQQLLDTQASFASFVRAVHAAATPPQLPALPLPSDWAESPPLPSATPAVPGLKDAFMRPVQRPPRYKLLLEALLAATPARHPAHAAVQATLRQATCLASSMNEGMTAVSAQKRLADVQQELLGGTIQLMSPGRSLVREAEVRVVSVAPPRCKPGRRTLLLFSDGKVVLMRRWMGSAWHVVACGSALDAIALEGSSSPHERLHSRNLSIGSAALAASSPIPIDSHVPSPPARSHSMGSPPLLPARSSLRLVAGPHPMSLTGGSSATPLIAQHQPPPPPSATSEGGGSAHSLPVGRISAASSKPPAIRQAEAGSPGSLLRPFSPKGRPDAAAASPTQPSLLELRVMCDGLDASPAPADQALQQLAFTVDVGDDQALQGWLGDVRATLARGMAGRQSLHRAHAASKLQVGAAADAAAATPRSPRHIDVQRVQPIVPRHSRLHDLLREVRAGNGVGVS